MWSVHDIDTTVMSRRNVCFVLFWTWGVFASCFRSLWLVKVCQWVTLTPVRRCREGGADEVGHMVAHCSLTRNSRCNKTSPSNHWSCCVASVATFFLFYLWMDHGLFPLVALFYWKQTDAFERIRRRETVLRFAENRSPKKTWLLGLTRHFIFLCNLHFG